MSAVIYCPETSCRSFIPPRQIQDHIGTCERCNSRICILCRLHEHPPNNNNCAGMIIPDYAASKLKFDFQAALAALEKDNSEGQRFIARLITRNTKSVAEIPGRLEQHIIDQRKSEIRARHFVLEDAARALFEDMQVAQRKLRQQHEVALEFKRKYW